MSGERQDVADQAISWHLSLADATAAQWQDFVHWLEADDSHRLAYDRITLDDALLAPTLQPERQGFVERRAVVEDEYVPQPRRKWLYAGGGAMAAALVAAILLPTGMQQSGESYAVATALGERRSVTLSDGTRIDLNGGTRLLLTHGSPRYATLESGEAVFHVRHNTKAPFTVRVGDVALQDMGTVFNVTRNVGGFGVQVAEGAVLFQPRHEAVTLKPGMALAMKNGDDRIMLGHVAVDSVGSWQQGQLSFRDASIDDVAAAVERATGDRLVLETGLGDRSFTGTINIAGGAERSIPRLAALIGVRWRHNDGIWTLSNQANEQP